MAYWHESSQRLAQEGEAWRLPHFPSSQHSVLSTPPTYVLTYQAKQLFY